VSPQYQLTTREDRAQARRRRRRRHIAISMVSTVIILGGLTVRILTASGWPNVRRSFFSVYWFKKAFGSVLSGFWVDVRMFLIIEVCVLALGLLIALIRTFPVPALYPVRMLAIVFVDVMRGVPTILLIFLIGFSVPALNLSGVPIGLTPAQTLRHVIVPQAVGRVVPPLLNDFIALQKDVALVSTLGVFEAFRAAQIVADQNFNYTPLLAAAALYLCVTIPMTRIVDHLQWRTIRERGPALALGPR
jgi:polar amino acid transport system permease protein